MSTELDTAFLGLWLDEELIREEFDDIVSAGWSSSQDQPARSRTGHPRTWLVDRSPSGGPGGGRFGVVAEHAAVRTAAGGPAEALTAWGRGPPEASGPQNVHSTRPEPTRR